MGPRPFGRGRCDKAFERGYNWGLQWGRDLSVAEGFVDGIKDAEIPQLQWGRDLSVAEG